MAPLISLIGLQMGDELEDTGEEVVVSYLSLKSRIFSESHNEEL
jgi:hypothetical protein